MKKLLIATTNPGKLYEYKNFLKDLDLKLVSFKDLGITQKAPEDASTFEENAQAKALFYNNISGIPTIADDGGFEIDYLNGEPGVRSHRWIHTDREDTDDEIITYALHKLKGVPQNERGAQLRLVLSLAVGGKIIASVEDQVRGIVGEKASTKRQEGFPYRSIQFFPKINKYYGELTDMEMEEYNHRKRAVEKLKPIIIKFVVRSS